MALDRDLPDAPVRRLSGTFLSKVFEGPYKDTSKWVREMGAWVDELGKSVKHLYFLYATCPKCAERLGRNDVVLLAQVG